MGDWEMYGDWVGRTGWKIRGGYEESSANGECWEPGCRSAFRHQWMHK